MKVLIDSTGYYPGNYFCKARSVDPDASYFDTNVDECKSRILANVETIEGINGFNECFG